MGLLDTIRLVCLGAIWGGSFVFMKVLIPHFSVLQLADLRIFISGIVMTLVLVVAGQKLNVKQYWKAYLLIGMVTAGIPFGMFSFAAKHLPASYSAILNSFAPIFGALFSVYVLGERLGIGRVLGLVFGIIGVAVISWKGPVEITPQVLLAMAACLIATMYYGLGGIITSGYKGKLAPTAMTACGQFAAGLCMFPLAFSTPAQPVSMISNLGLLEVGSLLGLSLVCSGIAFRIFYGLVYRVGPVSALTVTFLIPMFGMIWSNLFLGEAINMSMFFGSALIFSGIVLINGTRPRLPSWVWARKAANQRA